MITILSSKDSIEQELLVWRESDMQTFCAVSLSCWRYHRRRW